MADRRRRHPGTTPDQRRDLRRTQTDAERALWRLLRSRSLEGYKFRRQHGAGRYVLDFYCAEAQLAIEADGSQHYTSDGVEDDAVRTAELAAMGIVVLRFSNTDVLTNAEGVVEAILRSLSAAI